MSVRQTLASRSVHLRIIPRPANLSESREIFRVLQRFGEVSTYKSLRYEYQSPADNVALAIFRDESSAQQALDASPIRFALERVKKISDDAATDSFPPEEEQLEMYELPLTATQSGIDEILRPSQLVHRTLPATPQQPKPTGNDPPMPFDLPISRSKQVQKKWTKWFQVTVDRSRAVHQDFIERQPFWKQFSPMKSMAQVDLAKQVPHVGLSDVSKRPPNAHRTPARVLRGMSDYVENRMPTLRGMMEDSDIETGYRERRAIDPHGYASRD